MTVFFGIIYSVLLMGTFAIASKYYGAYDAPLPEWFYMFVVLGVAGVSVLWTLVHMLGGGIMGWFGGASWDGIKMGLLLGLAWSVGRLWPYVGVWSVAAFLFAVEKQWLHTIGSALFCLFCFGLNMMVRYIWARVEST